MKVPPSKWLKISLNSIATCWVDTRILAPLYLTTVISHYHSILVDAFYFYQSPVFSSLVTRRAFSLTSLGLSFKVHCRVSCKKNSQGIEVRTFFSILGFSVTLFTWHLEHFWVSRSFVFLSFWYHLIKTTISKHCSLCWVPGSAFYLLIH